MQIIKTDCDILKPLREKYFKSLPEFQELFIELMIPDSDCFLLKEENNTVSGYAIRTKERVLIEFYVIDDYMPHCSGYFHQIITNLSNWPSRPNYCQHTSSAGFAQASCSGVLLTRSSSLASFQGGGSEGWRGGEGGRGEGREPVQHVPPAGFFLLLGLP